MTGPQYNDIVNVIDSAPQNDHKFIELALTEQVSGALNAPPKTAKGILRRRERYPRGEHRGNGLKRIKAACKEVGISFSLLSHYGYAVVYRSGNIVKYDSRPNMVFAGTLHHFLIPAKPEEQLDENC